MRLPAVKVPSNNIINPIEAVESVTFINPLKPVEPVNPVEHLIFVESPKLELYLVGFQFFVYWTGKSTDTLRYQFLFDIDVPAAFEHGIVQLFNHTEFEYWWIRNVDERTFDNGGEIQLQPVSPMPTITQNPLRCPCCDPNNPIPRKTPHNIAGANIKRTYGDHACLDFTYATPNTRYRITVEADLKLDTGALKLNNNDFNIGVRDLPEMKGYEALFGLILTEPENIKNIAYTDENWNFLPMTSEAQFWDLPMDHDIAMIIKINEPEHNEGDIDEDEDRITLDNIGNSETVIWVGEETEEDAEEEGDITITMENWKENREQQDASSEGWKWAFLAGLLLLVGCRAF